MDEASSTRRLAAVLSIDAVGYSQLMSVDETATDRTVSAALNELGALVGNWRGRITAWAGDGFIAVFDSAVDAVTCAVAMARQRATRQDKVGDAPLQFRIGVNLGEVILRDNDAYGDAVNLAKRLEQYAEPGTICISRSMYEQVRNRCTFGFEFLGEHPLKNIPDPIAIYRVHAAAEGAVNAPTRRPTAALAPPSRPSIAVLPLTDMSEAHDRGWLCDGLSESIITGLSRFRELFVISRSSSFLYKVRPATVQEVGRELGVRYVLEGGVRTARERLRVSAQLIEAQTDAHVWADTYEERLDDVFAVEDRITSAIAGVLRGRIEVAERRRMKRHPEIGEAHSLLLQAKERFWKFTRDGVDTAERLCREAISVDPGYAAPWTLLSRLLNLRWRYGWTDDRAAALAAAEESARRAVELDEADAQAHAEFGFVCLYQKRLDYSIREYERALELNPNDADIMSDMADALQYVGRAEEAVELMERAMRLNPFFPDAYLWHLADAYFALGRYERAISTVYRMLNLAEGRRLLAASHALLGRVEEARVQAQEVLRLHPDFSISAWAEVQPDSNPEVLARFVEGLRLSGLPD